MAKNDSGMIAAKSGSTRTKTRFSGVYTRTIKSKRTGKPDIVFDICYRDESGKFRWEIIGYKSDGVNAAYANQRRGAILDALSNGEKPQRKKSASGMTFEEGWKIYEEKWLPNLSRPQEERGRYNRYIQEPLGNRPLDGITTLDLENLKTSLLKRGLSNATVRHVLSDIRRVYRKLSAWEVYNGNIPTNHLVMPKLDHDRTRFLSETEALHLLAALKRRSKTWHDIAFISLYTGMRKGEVLSLRGEHLDFVSDRILVKDAKTGSRVVNMTYEVKELLTRIRPESPADYVFHKRNGTGKDKISIDADESFVRAVKDCHLNDGISDSRNKVVFHTLRHTYCSWLAKSGVPLFTIGELVGHTSVQMTKRYSHLCPDSKQEAASRIGALMRQAKENLSATPAPDHTSSAAAAQDSAPQPAVRIRRGRRP
jgi:integrase